MSKKLIFLCFLLIFLSSPTTYAGCAQGGGKGFTIPTTPQEIAKTISQLPPIKQTPVPSAVKKPLVPSLPPAQQPVVAKVIWVKGTVKAMGPDKQIRLLQADAPITLHDALITGPDSQVQIAFSDHTIMTFMQNSMFYVNKYEFHPEKKASGSAGSFFSNLIEGGFRTVTGIISKTNSNDYRVSTDVAVMGVRGTDFSASFRACRLDMKRHSGTPFVQNDQGMVVLTESKPYASVPGFNKAPTFVKQEPAVFAKPLIIKPVALSDFPKDPPPSGGVGGGSCGPVPGEFNIRFR